MGKYGKYLKHYRDSWEKDTRMKGWLASNTEENVIKGQPEAYCKVCQKALRAHHGDLIAHSQTRKHRQNEEKFDTKRQPNLHNYGCVEVNEEVKRAEMKLAVFIAAHCSVKSIDHLGDILKDLGKGSPLENIKCHRTKCSRLIENVIAPEFLKDTLDDIGDSPYSLIVDEVTDNSTSKFMGVCVRYFSNKRKEMVVDFLGLVHVTDCTGKELARCLIEYLKSIGLPLKNLQAIGVDGAANMCGLNNSFYTHLKEKVPGLMLFKCVCHSVDKCAQHAFTNMPPELSTLFTETTNWFCHSAKRWDEYMKYYEAMHGKGPKKLVPLSRTRWLVWVPSSEVLYDQWYELRGFFTMKGEGPKGDPKARELAKFYNASNMLYIVFLKNLLSGVQKVSSAFERSNADLTKLYSDLRSLLFALAGRILKPQCIAEVSRPGMLRMDEVRMLKEAFAKKENNLPVDRINLGDSFLRTAQAEKVAANELNTIRLKCGQYIYTLCTLLLDKLPSNLDAVSKLKYLTPRMALSRTARPTFQQLPTELAVGDQRDKLEEQWALLGTLTLSEIFEDMPEEECNVDTIDIIKFWATVLNLKNAGGEQSFRELALFALKALSLPISNAVVERVFSVLSCIKCRRRNRLQLSMLEALIRLRVHLKVDNICCRQFSPTRAMYNRFTSDMYKKHAGHEADQAPVLRYELEADFMANPDDPAAVPVAIPEAGAELEEIDYEIVSELDSENFNEDLFVVCF